MTKSIDKQCKHCKRSLPVSGEFTLTMCGMVVDECQMCAMVRQGVMDDYWELSAEMRDEIKRIRKQYFQQ